jgi:hypothetical protein
MELFTRLCVLEEGEVFLFQLGPLDLYKWGDTWMQILTSFFTTLLIKNKNLQLEDTETPPVPVTNPL